VIRAEKAKSQVLNVLILMAVNVQTNKCSMALRISPEENLAMALMKQKNTELVHKVKGPLRCHKCRMMCRDAEHYLSHACKPKVSPTRWFG
jgi:hypothetical protein